MVEEDVMVGRDFFTFHQAIHKAELTLFCSLSTKNHNRQVTTTSDPSAYYLTTDDYCSLGVCFKRETILQHIAPHVGRPYYLNPTNYSVKTFPASKFERGYSEQDGLIRRIQEQLGPDRPIAYPHQPRAFHAGFYGYNRGPRKGGALDMIIGEVGLIIYHRERMKIASQRPEFYADSEPVPLQLDPWTSLTREQPQELCSLAIPSQP
jgi:hypothetical protein